MTDFTTNENSPARVWDESHLAPYAARARETRGRIYPEEEHNFRTAFQRDRDRIIHSTAFRRLEYKTQVFVNYEGDHYRTRLTHTLEVAQIGRTLARALGLNEDLTEAIALAHDLGHTPFGHAGEEALNNLMAGEGGFEHNAQGLRVVDLLESRYPDFPGLNLTYEVREGFVSHSARHNFDRKGTDFAQDEQATLEAQIVAVADEIAYDNHDLDDGLTSGIIAEGDIQNLNIWQSVAESMSHIPAELPAHIRKAQIIRRLIDMEVTDIIMESRRRIGDNNIANLADVRRHDGALIAVSDGVRGMKDELERYLRDNFYNYYTVSRMTNKARAFLSEMFRAYVADRRMLPPANQMAVETDGPERAVCDYIAGMTDRAAQLEYRRLFHPFERT